jgi:hypothetical protein
VWSKAVPAVTEYLSPQIEHLHRASASRKPPGCSQFGANEAHVPSHPLESNGGLTSRLRPASLTMSERMSAQRSARESIGGSRLRLQLRDSPGAA